MHTSHIYNLKVCTHIYFLISALKQILNFTKARKLFPEILCTLHSRPCLLMAFLQDH